MEYDPRSVSPMKSSSTAPDEAARLAALARYEILDTEPERDFDDLVLVASSLCDAPMARISFVDRDREWFKARRGDGPGVRPAGDVVRRPRDPGRRPARGARRFRRRPFRGEPGSGRGGRNSLLRRRAARHGGRPRDRDDRRDGPQPRGRSTRHRVEALARPRPAGDRAARAAAPRRGRPRLGPRGPPGSRESRPRRRADPGRPLVHRPRSRHHLVSRGGSARGQARARQARRRRPLDVLPHDDPEFPALAGAPAGAARRERQPSSSTGGGAASRPTSSRSETPTGRSMASSASPSTSPRERAPSAS